MSYSRENDVTNKKTGRTMKVFRGYHSGYGKTDQPDEYAAVCDFDFRFAKPLLRNGERKNQGWGYPASISGAFAMSLGGSTLVGQVANGVCTVYEFADILAGIRKYYTVGELAATKTVAELSEMTVNDLINRGGA
jgi:hypothetical protein